MGTLDNIYISTPINKQAALVASQRGCIDDIDLSKCELHEIKAVLEKKHKLLKNKLGIKSKRQHKNVMFRYVKYGRRLNNCNNAKTLYEYIFLGKEINKICSRIREIK